MALSNAQKPRNKAIFHHLKSLYMTISKKKIKRPTLQVFSTRIPGPELKIEKFVYKALLSIVGNEQGELWVGASVPIGAGKPDLLITRFNPELFNLNRLTRRNIGLISYLRVSGKATIERIVADFGLSAQIVRKSLDELEDSRIVKRTRLYYSLEKEWKSILTDITSIEVKVSNWKKALDQASRNTLFSHLSYIALPEKVAIKTKADEAVKKSGIGIISVSESGSISILKASKRNKPKVWYYYYQIADLIAKQGREQ